MGSRLRLTLFSLDEANRTVDEIRPALERLVNSRRELARLDRRIEVLSLVASGVATDNPDARALAEAVGRRERLSERLRLGVDEIQSQGPLVKDLDHGLVDFYSVSGDRLIFLCWHLGELKVEHWHSLDGGFTARRPIVEEEA